MGGTNMKHPTEFLVSAAALALLAFASPAIAFAPGAAGGSAAPAVGPSTQGSPNAAGGQSGNAAPGQTGTAPAAAAATGAAGHGDTDVNSDAAGRQGPCGMVHDMKVPQPRYCTP